MKKMTISMFFKVVLMGAVCMAGMSVAVANNESEDEVIITPLGGCNIWPCNIDV